MLSRIAPSSIDIAMVTAMDDRAMETEGIAAEAIAMALEEATTLPAAMAATVDRTHHLLIPDRIPARPMVRTALLST